MEDREHQSLPLSLVCWKIGMLRAHSKARALVKNTRLRLSRGRSLKFHRNWMNEGDLVFDVGANVGKLTAIYLELGARVMAVEPQQECVRRLEARFRGNPRVAIAPMAVGAAQGQQDLMLSDIRSPISSMSQSWIQAVKSSGRFRRYGWSRSVVVPVTTLDSLIARYGEPEFCKIDVEGFEAEVLRGLSRPLKSLSFEFHAEFLPEAHACFELLQGLGDYRYNYSIENRMLLELPEWVDHEEARWRLQMLPFSSIQGDVYAKRLG